MNKNLILIVVLFASYYANSQEIKKYSGAYSEIKDRAYFYNGKATYSYIEKDNLRVYDGNFEYSILEDISSIKHDNKISITGTYENNLATGLWTYKKKLNNTNNETTYYFSGKKYKIYIPYTQASGNYYNGYRVGEWKLTTIGEKKTKEKIIANFDKLKFISEFLFMTENYSVTGVFSDDGLLNKEWVVKWEIEEVKYKSVIRFNKGVFVKSITQDLSNGEIIKKFDNSEFVNSFFENLERNNFFSVIDNKIYILKYKEHSINSSYNLQTSSVFKDDIKKLDFELLYKSIDFWIYPIVNGYDYNEYNIFSEIRKGIKKINYKIEKEIVNISEDELLKLSDNLKIKNIFVQNIRDKRQQELEKTIAKEKSIAEKKLRKEANEKKLIENFIQIDKNKKKIMKLYYYDKKKKHLFAAIKIVQKEYYYDYGLSPSLAGVSYASYSGWIKYSDKKLEKSEEYLPIQEKFINLHKIKTKSLEKELKEVTNSKEIIDIINSFNYGN